MRLLNRLKNRIRTRNDRKSLKKKNRGSFLQRLFGIKESTKPTFWQLRGRKCKTCKCLPPTGYGASMCSSSDGKRYGRYTKQNYVCCSNYEPKKSRAL